MLALATETQMRSHTSEHAVVDCWTALLLPVDGTWPDSHACHC